jgi:AcrR family transcriptional regulator
MSIPSGDEDPRVVRTRRAVRDAVRSLVQRAGFEAVSHQRVAEEAGVGRATVYRHWPDRTDLLLEVVAEAESPRGWASSGDLVTDLTEGLERLRRQLASPLVPELVALIGRAEWDPELRETKLQLLASGTAGLRQALEAGVERGELPTNLDVAATIARLAGPLLYRRILAHAPIGDDFVSTIVTGFVREASRAG